MKNKTNWKYHVVHSDDFLLLIHSVFLRVFGDLVNPKIADQGNFCQSSKEEEEYSSSTFSLWEQGDGSWHWSSASRSSRRMRTSSYQCCIAVWWLIDILLTKQGDESMQEFIYLFLTEWLRKQGHKYHHEEEDQGVLVEVLSPFCRWKILNYMEGSRFQHIGEDPAYLQPIELQYNSLQKLGRRSWSHNTSIISMNVIIESMYEYCLYSASGGSLAVSKDQGLQSLRKDWVMIIGFSL